jgi:hypothetical protein
MSARQRQPIVSTQPPLELSHDTLIQISIKASALQAALEGWVQWLSAYSCAPSFLADAEKHIGLGRLQQAHLRALAVEAALGRAELGPATFAQRTYRFGGGIVVALRDWLLRLRGGDPAGWGDAAASGGWPCGAAAQRLDVLKQEVKRLDTIVKELEKAVPAECGIAADGPMSPDGFRFGGLEIQDLTRAQYALLAALWSENGNCPGQPILLVKLADRLCPRAREDKVRALMALVGRTQYRLDRKSIALSITRSNDTLRLTVNPL